MASVIPLSITLLWRGGVVAVDEILLSHPKFWRLLNNLLVQC